MTKLWQRLLMQQQSAPPTATAYRYFQIFTIINNGGNLIAISEVQFLDETGTSFSLKLGTTATATSTYPGYPASNTLDGNTHYNNVWMSDLVTENVGISYDANTPKIASKLRLFPSTTIPNRSPKHFIVQGSNASISGPWTAIKTFNAADLSVTWREYDLT